MIRLGLSIDDSDIPTVDEPTTEAGDEAESKMEEVD